MFTKTERGSFCIKVKGVLNDCADFINRVYQVRPLTELWDVTLIVKIKNMLIVRLIIIERLTDVFGSPINESSRKIDVFKFYIHNTASN